MKNNLTVTITGPIRSGKTSLALEIKRLLVGLGVDSIIRDEDGQIPPDHAMRAESVVRELPRVTIVTKSTWSEQE